jgi:hypothetical protein
MPVMEIDSRIRCGDVLGRASGFNRDNVSKQGDAEARDAGNDRRCVSVAEFRSIGADHFWVSGSIRVVRCSL